MFNKSCRWLDSNPGPLVSEATALPTASQPLPYSLSNSRTRKNELVKIREKTILLSAHFLVYNVCPVQPRPCRSRKLLVTGSTREWVFLRSEVTERRGSIFWTPNFGKFINFSSSFTRQHFQLNVTQNVSDDNGVTSLAIIIISGMTAEKILNKKETQKFKTVGQWFGSVGRAVSSDSRGPRFESSHRRKVISNIYFICFENKEKEAWNGPLFLLSLRTFTSAVKL